LTHCRQIPRWHCCGHLEWQQAFRLHAWSLLRSSKGRPQTPPRSNPPMIEPTSESPAAHVSATGQQDEMKPKKVQLEAEAVSLSEEERLMQELDQQDAHPPRVALTAAQRKRRKVLIRMRQIWFHGRAIEFRKQLLARNGLRMRDIDQKQIRALFKVLDKSGNYVVVKREFMCAIHQELTLQWSTGEAERFWRLLTAGQRLCFQAFTLIFRADEQKAKRANAKLMNKLKQMLPDDDGSPKGHAVERSHRFSTEHIDERDFPGHIPRHEGRGHAFGRRRANTLQDDERVLLDPESKRNGAAFSFGHHRRTKGGDDKRHLHGQESALDSRGHRFGHARQADHGKKKGGPTKRALPKGGCALAKGGSGAVVDLSAEVELSSDSEESTTDGFSDLIVIASKCEPEVVRLQARLRGWLARVQLRRELERRRLAKAATSIQAAFRGMWSRRLARWLRVAASYHTAAPCAPPRRRRPKRRRSSRVVKLPSIRSIPSVPTLEDNAPVKQGAVSLPPIDSLRASPRHPLQAVRNWSPRSPKP